MPVGSKIDILIHTAQFEELQHNSLRARKIYEQLEEIAPGLIKATIARINFEKREKNLDKAGEIFYEAFTNALSKDNSLAVTYLVTQYARFLSHKINDPSRAMEMLSKAVNNEKCANKVLFLQYVNLARQQPNSRMHVKSIF